MKPERVLFLSGPGGHFSEIRVLFHLFSGSSRLIVTHKREDTDTFATDIPKRYVEAPHRNLKRFARNLFQSYAITREYRPDLIVTTGAGVALALCYVGKLFGAKIVHIECSAQIEKPSLFGRLVAPIVDLRFVQWESTLNFYRNAKHVNLLFSTPSGPSNSCATQRGKIFVTVGTTIEPFNRLIEAVDEVASSVGDSIDFVVQYGNSDTPKNIKEAREFLGIDAFEFHLSTAEVVITHAGVGCIAASMLAGKKILVVPRLAKYGEHANDHQEEIAGKVADEFEVAVYKRDCEQTLSNWLETELQDVLLSHTPNEHSAIYKLPSKQAEIDKFLSGIRGL